MNTKNIKIGSTIIGSKKVVLFAGPCAVESEEQFFNTISKMNYVDGFRGGAYKPRTSPYSFQGLEKDGLDILAKAKKKFNKIVVTELTKESNLSLFDDVDIIQVGARNMQNFELLKTLGKQTKPVLLKRGFGCTIDELIEAANYISKEGNNNIILVERGIRTFENSTRYTLDISSVPVLKSKTEFPVFVDPSHASGDNKYIESLSLAAVAAGADGLFIEVHENPSKALCDSAQAITPDEYNNLTQKLDLVAKAIGRYIL